MAEVVSESDVPIANNRMMPPMTWNGTLAGSAETATHYLSSHGISMPKVQWSGDRSVAGYAP